jgi:hypothetical protein
MFRFLPTIFFPASMPGPAAGTLVEVLTLCASMTQADGSASRFVLAWDLEGARDVGIVPVVVIHLGTVSVIRLD